MAKNLQFTDTQDKGSVMSFAKAHDFQRIELYGEKKNCAVFSTSDEQASQRCYVSPQASPILEKALASDGDKAVLSSRLKVVESIAYDMNLPKEEQEPTVCLTICVKTAPVASATLW